MAIVISGVNNNDKITASDGTIDLLSGVNFNSELTVPSFKVGNNIQIGNAGIITATTYIGNLTGNVNATSNLLLQIGGSEKFRVGSSGQLGIGGANYGTSGQVLTSGGSGSAATWSTITGTTINNNANNRVITGSGTANTLEGESTLTFNGTDLEIQPASAAPALFIGDSNRSGAGQGLVHFRGNWNGTTVARITIDTGDDTTNKDDGIIRFDTSSTGSLVERVRINRSGYLGIGNVSSPDDKVEIRTSANDQGVLIKSTGSTSNAIKFDANRSGANQGLGSIKARWNGTTVAQIFMNTGDDTSDKNDGYIIFGTESNASNGNVNATERLRISSEGYVTKPSHPSFCVRFQSGDGYVSTDIFRLTAIANNNFTWNTGGHYSTSTGKFTAPVAGVYFFEAQALADGLSNNQDIQDMMELRTNNGRVTYCRQRRSYFRTEDDANGYYANSTSGQVNLAVGDTVWFQRRNGLTYGYRNAQYTYFTGWLIG